MGQRPTAVLPALGRIGSGFSSHSSLDSSVCFGTHTVKYMGLWQKPLYYKPGSSLCRALVRSRCDTGYHSEHLPKARRAVQPRRGLVFCPLPVCHNPPQPRGYRKQQSFLMDYISINLFKAINSSQAKGFVKHYTKRKKHKRSKTSHS